jgi:hypothetical protein
MTAFRSADERRTYVLQRLDGRLRKLEHELIWALELPVPPDFEVPPFWVKGAIKRLLREIWPMGIIEKAKSGITPKALGELDGLLSSANVALNKPSDKERQEEEAIPQLQQLREIFVKWIAEILPKYAEVTQKERLTPANTARDSHRLTVGMSTPASMQVVAKKCRKSWWVNLGYPRRRQAVCRHRLASFVRAI